MFSSIRFRLKSLRRSDPDARIERKARNAAKEVTRTASRDLAQWEERNGYRRPESSILQSGGSESSKTLTERSRTASDFGKQDFLDFTTAHRSRTVSNAKLSADAGYNAVSQPQQHQSATLASPSPTLAPPPPPPSSIAASRSPSMPKLELQTVSLTDSMAPFGPTPAPPQQQQQRPRPDTPLTSTTPRVSISNADQTLKELEEKEALLAEIQKIRASIQHLKGASTTSPNLSIDVTSPTLGGWSGEARRSKSRLGSASPVNGEQRSAAPWLTDDRAPRPKSALGMSSSPRSPRSPHSLHSSLFTTAAATTSGRRRSVADIFAEDAPQPPQVPLPTSPRASTPSGRRASVAPQLGDLPFASATSSSSSGSGSKAQPIQTTQSAQSMQQPTPTSPRIAAAARPRTKSTSSLHSQAHPGRRGDTWRGEELPPLPADAAVKVASPTIAQQPSQPWQQDLQARPKSRTESVYTQAGRPRQQQQQRQIIDTAEEAKRRYSAALGRSATPVNNVRSTTPVNGRSTPTAGRSSSTATMTMAELQDRHLAKLRQMQGPATAKVREAEALSHARAEWERRTRLERQEQERKMRERAEADAQMKRRSTTCSQRPSMPSRRQTMSEDLLRASSSELAQLDAAGAPQAPVLTERRMSGARKAREWRKSLVLSEHDPRMVGLHEQDGDDGGEGGDDGGEQRRLPENAAQVARSRAKSTLGLERPQAQAYQQQQPMRLHSPSMSRSRTPDATSSMSPGADRRNSYFDPMPAAPRPGKHRRQLTVTDMRRMQEGAGRRRSSATGNAGASDQNMGARRMSQPLLDLETARATKWHPQWTQV